MPNEFVERIQSAAEETAGEAVWAQWSALTPLATPASCGRAWTIVDPEAVVLASLALTSVERRLEDLVAGWARAAGYLMSKPRFRALLSVYPGDLEDRVGDFARYAVEGGDTRWKSWASPQGGGQVPREKSVEPLRLTEGPSLVLRLRAGFGLNAKADILGMLLGLHGAPANLRKIVAVTGYSDRMIRTATDEMVRAGFIVEVEGRPSSFYVEPEPWAAVFRAHESHGDAHQRPTIPAWRYWAATFAFLCDVARWAKAVREKGWSDYVTSSRAADLYERHELGLRQAGIRVSPLPRAGDADVFLRAFHELVREVRSWTLEGLGG